MRAWPRFFAPFLITIAAYDLQRLYLPWVRPAIHVGDLYAFERAIFGIVTGGRTYTPNEWLQLHLHPALDALTGLAYLLFIPEFVLVALYFRFVLPRLRGSDGAMAAARAGERMAWAFLLVNLLGYATYLFFPAAPPWYVARYGFGQPPATLAPFPAGAMRFDEMFGTRVFEAMYAQSSNVLGALPSLHASYPVIAAGYAFRLRSLRGFCAGFAALIAFSAVYLDHHYVTDVVVGALYGLTAFWAVERKQSAGA